MKDKLNNKLSIGDKVAFAPGGSYSGISIGEIVKFTEKQVGIRAINGGSNCLQKPHNIHRNRLKTLAFYY